MIALIAAMPLETELLCRDLTPGPELPGGFPRHDGALCGKQTILVHSGIGKANASAAAVSLLANCRPETVISFGCGGAFVGSGLQVGDLAVASQELFGDEGVRTPGGFLDMEALGYPLLEAGEKRYYDRFPVDEELRHSLMPCLQQLSRERSVRLVSGPFVTVSTCSGSCEVGRELEARTGGVCENMEGAAVAQACVRFGVPFLELRGISNLVEERDLSCWDLKGAARLAQEAVQAVLAGWPGERR